MICRYPATSAVPICDFLLTSAAVNVGGLSFAAQAMFGVADGYP